jgi:hypothetical protein
MPISVIHAANESRRATIPGASAGSAGRTTRSRAWRSSMPRDYGCRARRSSDSQRNDRGRRSDHPDRQRAARDHDLRMERNSSHRGGRSAWLHQQAIDMRPVLVAVDDGEVVGRASYGGRFPPACRDQASTRGRSRGAFTRDQTFNAVRAALDYVVDEHKPDSRTFRALTDTLKRQPSEIVFVDDSVSNREGALRSIDCSCLPRCRAAALCVGEPGPGRHRAQPAQLPGEAFLGSTAIVIQMLCGLAVYSPNGAHGTKPTFV